MLLKTILSAKPKPGPVADLIFPQVKRIDKFHFEIVRGCQLRCVGCPNSTLQPKVERVEPDDFARCLANVDVDHVAYLRLFNFGEPLLHHDLAGILSRIPEQKWSVGRVEISTNAQFADWNQISDALKTGVLGQLVVSCDGDGTPEAYERLRPPSRWEKLIEFLERAKTLRDQYQPGLQLITRTICDAPEHQQRWRTVLEPRGWTPEFRDWMYLPESSVNMTKHALAVPKKVCSFQAVSDRLYVDFDGTVVPCCAHPRAAVLGNLREQSYNEIIRAQARARFLDTMGKDRSSMFVCNSCEF